MKTVYQFTIPDPFGYTPARLVWHQENDVVEVHCYGRIVARMPFMEFREQFEAMAAWRAGHSPELWAETEARNVPDITKLAGGEQE